MSTKEGRGSTASTARAQADVSSTTTRGAVLLATEPRRIEIYNADCLQFLSLLETGSVDVVTTDPAYSGMNNLLKLGHGRIVGEYKDRGSATGKWFVEFEDSAENYRKLLIELRRVLNPATGHLYMMFDSYSLLTLGVLVREYFDVKNLITWDKVSIGMGHYFRRRQEFILFATRHNSRKLRNHSIPDVWRYRRVFRGRYPTQKPVEVFDTMLFASAFPGAVVCDPFVGSGSSAIAALRNDCAFVGSDISPVATELTCQRIRAYLTSGVDILQPASAAVPGEPEFTKDSRES